MCFLYIAVLPSYVTEMSPALDDSERVAVFEMAPAPFGAATDSEKAFRMCVVIPARNEEASLDATVSGIRQAFQRQELHVDIIIVDDHSTDGTLSVAQRIAGSTSSVRVVSNDAGPGFGAAVRAGLSTSCGDGVAVMMADGSDEPVDAVSYSRLLAQGWDCVFGSRFIEPDSVLQYPLLRRIVNRLGNWWIMLLTGMPYNDTTNAFKAYSRHVLDGLDALTADDFSLTVELPLKTIAMGCRHAVIPIKWYGRRNGKSKWRLASQSLSYLKQLSQVWRSR